MARAGSLTRRRIRSATSTPPGSRSVTTSWPSADSTRASPSTSVVLPAPSMPSTVINTSADATRLTVVTLAALEPHPHAAAVLGAAAAGRPSHAYLLHGPAGSGKRAAARAVAAELLARGAGDPDGVRTRVL